MLDYNNIEVMHLQLITLRVVSVDNTLFVLNEQKLKQVYFWMCCMMSRSCLLNYTWLFLIFTSGDV